MKFRARLITLLAVSVIGAVLAPVGAHAARASNPAVAPFSQPMEHHNCSTRGTGTCTSEASADRTGRLSGASTSYVKEDPDNGVTDTALAFSRGGINVAFSLPKSGASSVVFTVDSLIKSATASRSNMFMPTSAEVYFLAYARAGNNNCTSCTVTYEHMVADANDTTAAPTARTDHNETFSFVLKSAAGDRLTGRVEVLLWLTELTSVGESSGEAGLLPILGPPEGPMEGSAEARGDAVLKSISATFNP